MTQSPHDGSWREQVRARARSFGGEQLREIAFPLGGIGTGAVSLGGRGQLRDWEIFNRPAKGRDLPYTFFSLNVRPTEGNAVSRVLERQILPPYNGGFGLPTGKVSGLPRLREATFRGLYPWAWIDFEDDELPISVQLEAFNPFAPLDADRSGLPVAIFRWRLRNRTASVLQTTVAFSLLNAVGYGAPDSAGNMFNTGNRHAACFGQNFNEYRDTGSERGFALSSLKYAGDDPRSGTMALMTDWKRVTYLTHWERAGWWDDLQNFWDDLTSDGLLPNGPQPSPSPDGQTDVCSLGLVASLGPGAEVTLPFVLAWNFPGLVNQWNGEEAVRFRRLGNFYAERFQDAWSAGEHVLRNLAELEEVTVRYSLALVTSTLPDAVVDAVSSQVSTIRTPTCLRTADGRFHAFEGCGDNVGCCPLNCTHVWNYEQSLAHLFPDLERTMRETDFGHNTEPSGVMRFRTLVPLTEGVLWHFPPAADGQMGSILKLYREWRISGDTAWMESLWPAARRVLEFAWSPDNSHSWDADRDGVMEGIQHNTYDIEFCGPNSMMGSWYLAALLAAAEMAAEVGDEERALSYRELARRGSAGHDPLFNGDYYSQEVRFTETEKDRLTQIGGGIPLDGNEPRYQYGPGCLSDQVLGQWFAHCVGLGYALPQPRVQSSIRAIFEHNFRRSFADHANCQRIYALNDEAGLLLCSWPRGGRPRYPFPYADEVWTGIEYHVAAHLIFEGFIEEGLEVVQAVRNRYDGARRNPWDEVECGHHYARAMASWSLLLALSGTRYDGVSHTLEFNPRAAKGDCRFLFTAGAAWGTVGVVEGVLFVEVYGGSLLLKQIESRLINAGEIRLRANRGERRIPVEAAGTLVLDPAMRIETQQQLRLDLQRG